jgi:hypothetical protein
MSRALLIFFLLGAQLVSWNASPLFLCLDRDGAVCVDLGPNSCTCCRHHHHAQTARNGTGAGAMIGDRQAGCIDAPFCDCTHVQITVAWTAVTVSRQESRSVVFPAVSAILADGAGNGVGSLSTAGHLLIGPACGFASGMTGRSAVLRC